MSFRRKIRVGMAAALACAATGAAQAHPRNAPQRGVFYKQEAGRTELHVDGAPFFVHAATFPYFRLPPDLWERSLQMYRELGINTVDLAIPRNWHEVQQGQFDFEGRTNPRRNLRRLLRLITEAQLKAIVRPEARVEGWRKHGAPPWPGDARAAFVPALLKELEPFFPGEAIRIPDREARRQGEEKTVSGPVILWGRGGELPQPPAALATSTRGSAPLSIRLPLLNAGSDAEANSNGGREVAARPPPGIVPASRVDESHLVAIEHAAQFLQTDPHQPPAGGRIVLGEAAPPDDLRPTEASLSDPILLSRWLLAQGVTGITYDAIQDSLAPAGFAAPGANRFVRVDSALDINASTLPGARNILRNGLLAERWGEFLASAHKRADLAVIVASDGKHDAAVQLAHAAVLAGLSVEFVNPQRLTAEHLLQRPILVFPEADSQRLPADARASVLEYTQRGGTLVVYPARPTEAGWEALWAAEEKQPGVRPVGNGRSLEVIHNPFAWVKAADYSARRADPNAAGTVQELHRWLNVARTHPIVQRKGDSTATVVMTQLVPNRGTGPLGAREAGSSAGLLTLTNLSNSTAEEQLSILAPGVGPRVQGDTSTPLQVTIPPRESLFLPLNVPLCSEPDKRRTCEDQILVSGAEFLRAERDGKTLELTFFTPARAALSLRLAQQPTRVRTDEMSIDGVWTPATRHFSVTIPRGPAPEYIRVVRIQLPYEPHVPKKPDPEKTGRRDYDYAVADGVRFPLAQDAALETYPPLIILKGDQSGRMVIRAKNYDLMGRGVDFRMEGPIRGDGDVGLDAGEMGFKRIDLKAAPSTVKPGPAFLEGQMQVRSGRDQRHMPVAFVAVGEEGTVPYLFDFDRDGHAEWVLEDDHLRIVASPENGGRIVSLVDKESGLSLGTSLGFLEDIESAGNASPASYANAPYTAAWTPGSEQPELTLTSTRTSLRIEKKIRITEKQAFEVKYTWSGAHLDQKTLVVAGSVPVTLHGDTTTRFCWEKRASNRPAPEEERAGSPDMHCAVFTPLGQTVNVPEGAGHIEVRTPGSYAIRIEFETGRMSVVMKNYSAQLRLEFPRPETGTQGAENLVRFKAVVVE